MRFVRIALLLALLSLPLVVTPSASALDSAASPLARTAISKWLGSASGGCPNPISRSRSRFSSVAIAISADCTPSACRTSALTRISVTESA